MKKPYAKGNTIVRMKHIKAALLLAAAMLLLTGCGANPAEQETVTFDTAQIIEWDSSKEAAEKLQAIRESGSKAYFTEENFELVRESLYAGGGATGWPDAETENTLEKEECGGSEVYTLSAGNYDSVVLYIHGGAWVYDIDPLHVNFCDKLARRLNAKVYMPLYPLAPQYDYEDTYDVILALYRSLQEQGKPLYVMGDSAGGNIALGLLHLLKENGIEMPEKVVLMAPAADMTFSNEAIAEYEADDPELAQYGCLECAKMWAGDLALEDPLLSAVNADVSGYPDTLVFQGTYDILCPDNLSFYEHMKAAGCRITLVKAEGLWHVFSLSDIPEQEQSLQMIENFCK